MQRFGRLARHQWMNGGERELLRRKHGISMCQRRISDRDTRMMLDNIVKVTVNATTMLLKMLDGNTNLENKRTAKDGGGILSEIHACEERTFVAADLKQVMGIIEEDYLERAYFVTGEICSDIYVPDCEFADPTISFKGVELWKRNIKLLVPFFIDPKITLVGLCIEDEGNDVVGAKIRAEWILNVLLALPWKPDIYVLGSTLYSLRPPSNDRIEKHVESWNIDGVQALAMIFLGAKRMGLHVHS